jgi:hypothetical protein
LVDASLIGGTMRGGLFDDACQCTKLLGAGGYSRINEYAIWVSPSVGFDRRDDTGHPVLLPTGPSLIKYSIHDVCSLLACLLFIQ